MYRQKKYLITILIICFFDKLEKQTSNIKIYRILLEFLITNNIITNFETINLIINLINLIIGLIFNFVKTKLLNN